MCKIIECNLQALLGVFCWLSFAFPVLTCQPVMAITEKQLSVERRQCALHVGGWKDCSFHHFQSPWLGNAKLKSRKVKWPGQGHGNQWWKWRGGLLFSSTEMFPIAVSSSILVSWSHHKSNSTTWFRDPKTIAGELTLKFEHLKFCLKMVILMSQSLWYDL